MKRRSHAFLPLLAGALLLGACNRESTPPSPEEVEGWAPVYSQNSPYTQIRSAAPRDVVSAGKIHVRQNLLLQVEPDQGIHAIDIANPSAPKRVAFLEIGGCQEVAVRDNLLYANNGNDLVVVDITNLQAVQEVQRVPATFHLTSPNRPPGSGWSECIDPAKGSVVAWERKTLHRPTCLF